MMNRKLAISLIAGMALVIAVLVGMVLTGHYNGSRAEEVAANMTAKQLFIKAKADRDQLAQWYEVMKWTHKEKSWMTESRGVFLTQMSEVVREVDSFSDYVDSIAALPPSAIIDQTDEGLSAKDVPHHLRQWMDSLHAHWTQYGGSRYDSSISRAVRARFIFDLPGADDWEQRTFPAGMSGASVKLQLARIKASVAGLGVICGTELFINGMHEGCPMFSPYLGVAVVRQSVVLPGDVSEVEIFPYANDWLERTNRYIKEVEVDGQKVAVYRGEMGDHKYIATKPGWNEHHGRIVIAGPAGQEEEFPVSWRNYVLPQVVSVAFDDPLQLKAGDPTPLVISPMYLAPSELVVSVDRGVITGKDGHYTWTVNEPGPVSLIAGYMRHGRLYNIDTFHYSAR